MRDPNQKIIVDKNGKVKVQTINSEPTLAQQQFKDQCDINVIMAKYQKTGEFAHATKKEGRYADFTGITDYKEMLDTVQYAKEAFSLLPAKVRARFRNDPAELLAFVQDDKNYDEALKLGLVERKPQTPEANSNDATQRDDTSIASTKTKKAPPVPPESTTTKV